MLSSGLDNIQQITEMTYTFSATSAHLGRGCGAGYVNSQLYMEMQRVGTNQDPWRRTTGWGFAVPETQADCTASLTKAAKAWDARE